MNPASALCLVSRPVEEDVCGQLQPVVRHKLAGGARSTDPSRLVEYLRDLRTRKFTGFLNIHFVQGKLGRVERYEEILKNQPR
jgi:hypothetical protein